jgi:hypothetical protein
MLAERMTVENIGSSENTRCGDSETTSATELVRWVARFLAAPLGT